MAAIAAPLDEVHAAKVSELWDLLERELGLTQAAAISPVPHFSFQSARDYDLALLADVVEKIASAARPLRVHTAGVGVFPGAAPVVYIPVVRSPELTRLQVALWSAGAVATDKPLPEYHPAAWIPHVTLAQGDVSSRTVGAAIQLLNERDLTWDLAVDSLAIIRGRGDQPQAVLGTYRFAGGSARNF